MRTFKLTLAYDGTNYAGWQSQSGQKTLQDTLERMLERITGEQIRTTASGRTDSGVHALAQVVSFDSQTRLAPEILARALNAELPHDMAALEVVEAPPGFHAIRNARRKRYRYVICDSAVRDPFRRGYAWQLFTRLDVAAMQRAGEPLVGKRDFSSFETSGSPRDSSVRTVFELTATRGQGCESHLVVLEVEADGFLYNMVRAITGTLVEVGRGQRPEAWPGEVLAARDRRRAAQTAPPQGLFLVRVEYEPW